jgi:hypothetical protein
MNDAPEIAPIKPAIKQAVILVHGMGEQAPMQTLRGFVQTMWVSNTDILARDPGDPAGTDNPIWWKPDPRTGSYELSRVTTRAGHQSSEASEGPRTDFFEFYWADLTEANTIEQLQDWFMSLLWRRRSQVPANVRSVWYILWAVTVFFGVLALWGALAKIFDWPFSGWASATLGLSGLVWLLAHTAVLGTFGDVARYVRAQPANIAARQAIRDRGLTLLRELSDGGQYCRIILVGHSLGTIIAYDLIKLFWSERSVARTMIEGDALHQACQACQSAGQQAAGSRDAAALDAYRAAQRAVFQAMQGRGGAEGPWLISDFVTVGSPLSHAQFLLEPDKTRLDIGIEERRFPVNPPLSEGSDGFLYQPHRRSDPTIWSAHHAAPFAAIVWNNLYDSAKAIVFGDLISGPVRDNFGWGVKDIEVTIRRRWLLARRFFTHTLYWTDTGDPAHLEALRKALDLAR